MKKANNITADKEQAKLSGRARPVLKILLLSLFAVIVITLVFVAPRFSISEIDVGGYNFYTKNQIIEKSGLRVGQNGFAALRGRNVLKALSFRCDAAETAVMSAYPYIKSVQITYIMPDKIRVDVEERIKSVIVPYFGSGLLIDGEGYVVDIVRSYRQSGLPVAEGMAVSRYEIGKMLPVDDDLKLDRLLSVVNALRQADRDSDETLAWMIETIDVGDMRNTVLVTNRGVDVSLGDGTELYYRISVVKEILAYGVEADERGSIIFTNNARPVFKKG